MVCGKVKPRTKFRENKSDQRKISNNVSVLLLKH